MMPLTLAADPFKHFAPVGLLLLMAIGFGAFTLVATHLLGTGRKGPIKGSVYESGMNPIGNARRRFNVRFYIVAMTFLVFDVEIVFLYPWAVSFASLGGTQGDALAPLFLGRMLFFVLTTIVAFVYAWRKGVFRYD